jgi:hypothetical protein
MRGGEKRRLDFRGGGRDIQKQMPVPEHRDCDDYECVRPKSRWTIGNWARKGGAALKCTLQSRLLIKCTPAVVHSLCACLTFLRLLIISLLPGLPQAKSISLWQSHPHCTTVVDERLAPSTAPITHLLVLAAALMPTWYLLTSILGLVSVPPVAVRPPQGSVLLLPAT